MAEAYGRQSPLANLALAARAVEQPGEAGVVLGEGALRGQLNLRGEVKRKKFRDAVAAALGVAPPRQPNTVAEAGGVACLWLGPDEWLVITPPARREAVLAELGEALAGLSASLTDVSDGRAVITLSGAHARDVLAKGCSLDLHARVFGPGRCAQSTLAQADILLHQKDDSPSFDIYVPRSFAEYLWAWLEDASAEYGMAILAG